MGSNPWTTDPHFPGDLPTIGTRSYDCIVGAVPLVGYPFLINQLLINRSTNQSIFIPMTDASHTRMTLNIVFFMYKCLKLIREETLTLFLGWVFLFPLGYVLIKTEFSCTSKVSISITLFCIFFIFLAGIWSDRDRRNDLNRRLSAFFPLIDDSRIIRKIEVLYRPLLIPSISYILWSWIKRFFFMSGFFTFQVTAFLFSFIVWSLMHQSVFPVYPWLYLYVSYTIFTISICWETDRTVPDQQNVWMTDLFQHFTELDAEYLKMKRELVEDPRPYLLKDPAIPLKRDRRNL